MKKKTKPGRIIKLCSISVEDLPIPAVKGGAIEIILEKLSNQTQKIDWHIFSSAKFLKEEDFKKFSKIGKYHYFDLLDRKKRLGYAFKNLIPEWAVYPHWIAQQIVSLKPDILLLNNEMIYFKYLFWIKKKLPNLKIILFLHNDQTLDKPQAKVLKQFSKNVFAILSVSQYLLKRIRLFLPDFPKEKQFCIHNASHLPVSPVSTSRKNQLRKKYNIASKAKVILFVGRITRYKGAYLLMEAIKYFSGKSDYRWVFVGSSHHGKDFIEPEFLKLRNSFSEKLQEKILMTGFITPDQTQDYYDMADLLVFPSLWQEPSGLVLFEAWARGVPVLATKVGGIPELVNQYQHAELISPKVTAQKLAEKIQDLLKDSKKLSQLSLKGLKFIKEYGNFRRMAKEFEEILLKLVRD